MKDPAKLDPSLLQGRRFKLWHYIVSHGQMLIRSSIGAHETTNIDIWFDGVRYVELGSFLGEIALDDATDEERVRLRAGSDEFFDQHRTTVIVSGTNRLYVVSSFVSIEENQLDLFETPYGNIGWLPKGFDTPPEG